MKYIKLIMIVFTIFLLNACSNKYVPENTVYTAEFGLFITNKTDTNMFEMIFQTPEGLIKRAGIFDCEHNQVWFNTQNNSCSSNSLFGTNLVLDNLCENKKEKKTEKWSI